MSASTEPSREPAFFWTLPVAGDARHHVGRDPAARDVISRTFTDARRGRFDFYDYLFQVARAAQVAGFQGVFVPWHEVGDDPWIVTAALARSIERLVFVPEVQPGFATPVYFAKLAASFQRFAGPRLAYALSTSTSSTVRRVHGEPLDGPDFLRRAAEFVVASAGVTNTEPYDFEGQYFQVQGGGLAQPLGGRSPLPLYTSGDDAASLDFAAEHADVHLLSPTAHSKREVDRLVAATAARGRTVQAGLRAFVLARETELEAEQEARFLRLPEGAIVGSHEHVTERLEEFLSWGISQFVLDAAPRLEEAYRFGEHIFPRLSVSARPRRTAA